MPRLQAETTSLDNGDHIQEPERMRREKDKAGGGEPVTPSSRPPRLSPEGHNGPTEEAEGRGVRSALVDEPSSAQHGAEVLVGRTSVQDRSRAGPQVRDGGWGSWAGRASPVQGGEEAARAEQQRALGQYRAALVDPVQIAPVSCPPCQWPAPSSTETCIHF